VFYVDRLALIFVMALAAVTLVLWLGYRKDNNVREHTLLLLLVAGGSGLALSGDIFNVYVFYEIVAVASYGLAASQRSGAGFAASLRYLILGALGSSLILLGISIIYALTGTLNLSHLITLSEILHGPAGLAAFALMLIGFSVKAELFPVNTWVPEVYTTAPVRVSALLGGVISKLALLVILRLLVLLYADTPAPLLLLGLGVLSVVSGELAALRATTLRQVLAYSSIGQLGLIAVAFSIPGPAGILAGIALALHHAIAKPALFMLAQAWGGQLIRLRGAAKRAPWSAVLFILLALSLIGVPPLPGFWAKLLLVQAALAAPGSLYAWIILAVLASAVVETAYFIRIARTLYAETNAQTAIPECQDLRPAWTFAGILLLAMLTAGPVGYSLSISASQASDAKLYRQNTLPVWQVNGGRP
jgi:formate hydrogenlyase subunit 3/multisubunit Na+/H+ antiporter MnhD subunit